MKSKVAYLLAAALFFAVFAAPPGVRADTLAAAKTPLGDASSAKRSNIELAVEMLDGTTVYEDGYFSFNEVVGPRTASRGYQNAVNGRGVKAMGGGVSQAATTLYLALKKLDGIKYDQKKTYGSRFADSYVSSGKDAIVTDYRDEIDFSFWNSGESFTINMWLSDGHVRCTLTAEDWSDDEPVSGEGFSEIYLSGNDAQISNIELAADSLNDTSLESGDTFSFNDIVGPRTARYGYQKATNGRGVKVVGGGVAQVASALWLAIKDMDDIRILERKTYGSRYNQEYVSDADDAIVTDYSNGDDFRFRYTGDGTMFIYTYVEDDTLYCEVSIY